MTHKKLLFIYSLTKQLLWTNLSIKIIEMIWRESPNYYVKHKIFWMFDLYYANEVSTWLWSIGFLQNIFCIENFSKLYRKKIAFNDKQIFFNFKLVSAEEKLFFLYDIHFLQ